MALVKVQFGCGLSNPDGWLNYDSSPSVFVRSLPFSSLIARAGVRLLRGRNSRLCLTLRNIADGRALYGDIVKGLPLCSESVDLLYASHVLEHLPLREFRLALRECLRILKPDAVFRLVVPNLEYFVLNYLQSSSASRSIEFSLQTGMGSESFPNLLSRFRGDSHHLMFDEITLRAELLRAGFSHAEKAEYGSSLCEEFSQVEDQSRWSYPCNVGFECVK